MRLPSIVIHCRDLRTKYVTAIYQSILFKQFNSLRLTLVLPIRHWCNVNLSFFYCFPPESMAHPILDFEMDMDTRHGYENRERQGWKTERHLYLGNEHGFLDVRVISAASVWVDSADLAGQVGVPFLPLRSRCVPSRSSALGVRGPSPWCSPMIVAPLPCQDLQTSSRPICRTQGSQAPKLQAHPNWALHVAVCLHFIFIPVQYIPFI